MEKLRVHNKRLNVWLIVDNGKVYDANTMIEIPEAVGALEYVEIRMNEVWNKMGEIDPIWGDLQLYHKYEAQFLRYRQALYGLN